jgi:hypothetical protein
VSHLVVRKGLSMEVLIVGCFMLLLIRESALGSGFPERSGRPYRQRPLVMPRTTVGMSGVGV